MRRASGVAWPAVAFALLLAPAAAVEELAPGNIRTFRTTAKLKEPRELFALPKELDCPQQAPRWPSECQVVEERIQHITWVPSSPEPYYVPSGKELKPQPVGEEAGTVIFQYYPMSAVNYFSRSTVGGSRLYLSACTTAGGSDELRFESRFESGNLAKAIKITSAYYELHLRTDLYTNRHMQWFYFRVSNTKKQMMYRFSIVNLSKPESLYNEGMRPLLYSTKDAQLHSIGWRRCGENIAYYKNDSSSEDEDQFPSYTLTFNIEFPHSDDYVYIAHCYPYTYSDLQEYLSRLQAHPVKSTFSKLRLLCRTLAGNNVYYLTITAPQNSNELEQRKKKAVIVSARVHPGETPSSWMMKGFIDFLTGDSNQARELRDKFIFKLVPMLNPDGVIVGNNRCSLTGKDLNRQYRTVIRETYPPVWHTKVLIRRLQEEGGVAMYVDLHAHSRKHNIFIYGCESRKNTDKRLQEQVFPLMLHKNAADKFSFENCKFRIQRSKEGTARVVIWMLGVSNSYTMEASFGGSELGGRMSTHFTCQDYESIGRTFCETLLDFYDEDPNKERLRNKIVTRLLKEGSNADEPTNIDLSDYSSDEGDTSSSSSEAEASRGNILFSYPAPPPTPNYMDDDKSIDETGDNVKSDKDKSSKFGRPRSVSLVNEIITKTKIKPASWHQFRHLPPPKCLTDIKKPKTQPTELQVKLNSLKKNIWTGIPDGEKGPISWGISSFAMNTYFTDSEALLRSCSKKLEELEEGKTCKDRERKKKKLKSKKASDTSLNKEPKTETCNKVSKLSKKRGKFKSFKTDSICNSANTNFTDIPKSNQFQGQEKKTKAFKKGALVATAVQTKKTTQTNRQAESDDSDSDAYIESTKKYKKKSKKSSKSTLIKTQSVKSKN